MAVGKRRSQRSATKQAIDGKQAGNPHQDNSRQPDLRVRDMDATKSTFENLPCSVRRQIYYHLGFPTENTFTLSTDINVRYNTKLMLRELYKIDLTFEGQLSVPWNHEINRRDKRLTPKATTAVMCTNSQLRDELYQLLYSQSLFLVHTPNLRRPTLPPLSERARRYITHVAISFNAIEPTKDFFRVTSYQEALSRAIAMVEHQLPTLCYFGINLWSFQLQPSIAIDKNRSIKATIDKNNDPRPDFRNTAFLTRALLDLMTAQPKIDIFALLRNMQPRGRLNWDRKDKNTARKAITRDLFKCMAKVYAD